MRMKGSGRPSCENVKCELLKEKLTAESLNHAYALASGRHETNRRSHTGSIFRSVFFQDRKEKWQPLEKRRILLERLMETPTTPTEPHPAVAICLNETVPAPSLEPTKFSTLLNYEEALGRFDESTLGWLPTWFPQTSYPDGQDLNPKERLTQFDNALRLHAPRGWETKSDEFQKQMVCESLIKIHSSFEL